MHTVVGVMRSRMWCYFVCLCLEFVRLTVSEMSESPDLQAGVHTIKRGVENQCMTPACKTSTAKMLSFMNNFADPCEEFHEFVCGNRNSDIDYFSHENFQIIDTYLKTKVDNQSKKYLLDFREFYGSCLDFDSSFNSIGNMKFIKKYTSTNLTGVFTELILTQSMLFFDIGLNLENEDGSFIFQITLPGESSLKTELKEWNIFQQVEKECEEHLENSVITESDHLENLYQNFEGCRDKLVMEYAEKYQKDMEFALGTIYSKKLQETLRKLLALLKIARNEDEITKMSISELSLNYGLIEWRTFYQGLANKPCTGDEIIEVQNPKYLKKAFNLMKNFDERGLVEILQEFSSLQLYKNIFHIHEKRKEFCMSLSQELMPDIALKIEYEVANPSSTQILHCKTLFNNMKETLKRSLQNSSLDILTKDSFMKKLSVLELGIMTTSDIDNIENNYKDIVVTKNHGENVLNLLKNYRKIIFSLVHTEPSAETLLTYFVSPFSHSPMTFYGSKFIVLHPALFNKLTAGYPVYTEVATLGLLLAQGIAKHFDLIGRLLRTGENSFPTDAYFSYVATNANNLLDTIYLKSPYSFHGTSFEFETINGSLFINEMIADNTAFRMVNDYLETISQDIQLPWIFDKISIEQIIIISAAQEFCGRYSKAQFIRDLYEKRRLPFSTKIQNMMSSSPSFSQAFNCSAGSAMDLDSSLMVQFPYNNEEVSYEYELPEYKDYS